MKNVLVSLQNDLLYFINSSDIYYSISEYLSQVPLSLITMTWVTLLITFSFIVYYIGYSHFNKYYMNNIYISQRYKWIRSYGSSSHLRCNFQSVSANSYSCEEISSSNIDVDDRHDFDLLYLKSINDDFGCNEEHYDDSPSTDFFSELYEIERCGTTLDTLSLCMMLGSGSAAHCSRLSNLSINYSMIPSFGKYVDHTSSFGDEEEICEMRSESLLRTVLNRNADFANIVSRLNRLNS